MALNEEIPIEEPVVQWDSPHFYRAGKLFIPRIFEAQLLGEQVPAGFNAVKVELPAAIRSDLQWQKPIAHARRYVEEGLMLLWHLDLELFDKSTTALTAEQHWMALTLAIDHFLQEIWPIFQQTSLGVCLYRGSLDFSQYFSWNDEEITLWQLWLKRSFADIALLELQTKGILGAFEKASPHKLLATAAGARLIRLFCAQSCLSYIKSLATPLSPLMPCHLALDAYSIPSYSEIALLLTDPLMDSFCLTIAHVPFIVGDICWNQQRCYSGRASLSRALLPEEAASSPPKSGVCLPKKTNTHIDEALESLLSELARREEAVRLFPEENLTRCWDGLDELLVISQGVSIAGLRQLAGFCAAGGRVVHLGAPLGVEGELCWEEYKDGMPSS